MKLTKWEKLYAKSFKDFVAKIEEWQPDYFVPVARKSCKLLKALNLPKERNKVFYHYYFEFNSDLDLRGKKIAIIDDSCHGRASLASNRIFFKKRSKNLADIKTFAFVGLGLKPSEGEFSYDPDVIVHHSFSPSLYKEYLILQDEFLLMQGIPLDLDHLTLQFEMPVDNGEINTFLCELRHYGYLYHIDYHELPPSLMKFTLDQPYLDEMKHIDLRSAIRIEGVRKIRFFLNKKLAKLYCVPMVFPALPDEFCYPLTCPLKSHIICFHELIDRHSKSQEIAGRMCFHCLFLHLSAALAKCLFQLVVSKSIVRLKTDSIDINVLDYERFFDCQSAKKIVESILNFVRPQKEIANIFLDFNVSQLPKDFISGACSLRSIYHIRSDLHKGYLKKKRKLKTALNVHHTLSFGELLRKYPEIPPWYLSQNLDILCDHDILIPCIDHRKNVWLRSYRTGENNEANKNTNRVERTKYMIPFAISLAVEQLKFSDEGVRPLFLTKLLANFILDHRQKQYTTLHCLKEEPHYFGADIFCDDPEMTGGIRAGLKDYMLLGNKYIYDFFYSKGKEYGIYKARNNWDKGVGEFFSDGLKYELLVYFELLNEITKLSSNIDDISTDPLVSLSINRTQERFLNHIYWNLSSWFGYFKNILEIADHCESPEDLIKMKNTLKFFSSIKHQPLVKIKLYANFPNLVRELDKNFANSTKFGALYKQKIRSSIYTKRIDKTKWQRLVEIAKLQNALSNLLLTTFSDVFGIFLSKDINIIPFEEAWHAFSYLYEQSFAVKLINNLKTQCSADRQNLIHAMNTLHTKLGTYFIIPKMSELEPLINRISDEVYQRAGKSPLEYGINNPVYIIVDMAKSKERYSELGLTDFGQYAAYWSSIVLSQFEQFDIKFIERGEGDKLLVGFFPDIPRTLEAVARLYETISTDEQYCKVRIWPIHIGAANAQTLYLDRKNDSYLKLATAAHCCDHEKNEKYLFVTEDFVNACSEKLQHCFLPLSPTMFVNEMDMQKKVFKKKVYVFSPENYASLKQNFSKEE